MDRRLDAARTVASAGEADAREANARLMDRFLAESQPLYVPRSLRRYRYALARFLAFLGPQDVTRTLPSDLSRFAQHRAQQAIDATGGSAGRSAVTIRQELAILSTFFLYLEGEELVSRNPAAAFQRKYSRAHRQELRRTAHSRRVPTAEEVRTLVRSCLDPQLKAVLVTLYKTGLRVGELAALDTGDVDLEAAALRVAEHPKRSRYRVLLDREAVQVLGAWFQVRRHLGPVPGPLFLGAHGRRISGATVTGRIYRHACRLGLDAAEAVKGQRITAHSFRHAFTTHLEQAGCPRAIISELRGDSPEGIIGVYREIGDAELRAEYERCMPRVLA